MKAKTILNVTISGKGHDRNLKIEDPSFIVGRGDGCDVVVFDDFISRRHLKIFLENGEVFVEDLRSSNGTWVNQHKIPSMTKWPLSPQDRISFHRSEEITIEVRAECTSLTDSKHSQVDTAGTKVLTKIIPLQAILNDEITDEDEESVLQKISLLLHRGASDIKLKAEGEAEKLLRSATQKAEHLVKAAAQEAADKYAALEADIRERISRLENQESSAQKRLQVIEEKEHILRTQVRTLEARVLEEMEKINRLKDEISTEQAQIASNRNSLENERRSLESQRELFLKEEAQMRALLQKEEHEAGERIREDSERALLEIQESKRGLKQLEEQKSALFDELELLRKQIEENEKTSWRLNEENEELRELFRISDRELSEKKLLLAQAVAELSTTSDKAELTKYNLELVKKERELIYAEIEKKQKDLTDHQNEVTREVEESRLLLEDNHRAAAELKSKHDATRDEFNRVKAELARRVTKTQEEIALEIKRSKDEQLDIITKAKAQAKDITDAAEAYARDTNQKADMMLVELKQEISARHNEAAKKFAQVEEKERLVDERLRELECEKEQSSLELQALRSQAMEALEAERAESLEELNSELEHRSLKHEEELRILRVKCEEDIASRDASAKKAMDVLMEKEHQALVIELQKKRAEHQLELARTSEVELAKIKDIRAQAEAEWQASRSSRAETVSSSVMAVVANELRQIKSKVVDDSLIESSGETVREVILDLMLGRNGAGAQKLNEIKKLEISSSQKKNTLHLKLKVAAAITLALIGTAFIFPRAFEIPGELIAEAVKPKDSLLADNYATRVIASAKERMNFSPVTTSDFKDSFVDNYLYTTDFLKIRLSKEFQDKWILELNDFFIHELDVKDTVIIKYVSLESAFISDLDKLRSKIDPQNPEMVISEMHQREKVFREKLGITFEDVEKTSLFYRFNERFWRSYNLSTTNHETKPDP